MSSIKTCMMYITKKHVLVLFFFLMSSELQYVASSIHHATYWPMIMTDSFSVKQACGFAPCGNGGTCNNTKNSFLCHCPKGWSGLTCEGKKSLSRNVLVYASLVNLFLNFLFLKSQCNLKMLWLYQGRVRKMNFIGALVGRGKNMPFF